MKRRNFLRLLPAMPPAFENGVAAMFSVMRPAEDALWKELIGYARWSPSPHNIQPWKVKIISAQQAELFYDPHRLIPYADKGSKFMTVGLGIFVENLSIAAHAAGYQLHFNWYGKPIDATAIKPAVFGNMTLEKATVPETFDRELIKQRKTSRLHYQPHPVSPDILEELTGIARDHGYHFDHSSEEDMVKFVLDLNRDTLFYDMEDNQTREELEQWIRFSEKEAETKKDGLWSRCMRFPGLLMRDFFHHYQHYDHGAKKKAINWYYLNSMKGTKTVAWIQGKFNTPEDCMQLGSMMARLWLGMTRRQVFMHPFGSIITNPTSHALLRQQLKISEEGNPLCFIVRLGYSHPPPRSFRLATDSILIN